MELTKDKLAKIRVSLDAALAAVAKEHGLESLRAGRCTYETTGAFTWKIEGLACGGLAKEEKRYEEGSWLGLPPRGSIFTNGGETFSTWGLNTTGTKVICNRADGKQFLFNLDFIRKTFPHAPELQKKAAG